MRRVAPTVGLIVLAIAGVLVRSHRGGWRA